MRVAGACVTRGPGNLLPEKPSTLPTAAPTSLPRQQSFCTSSNAALSFLCSGDGIHPDPVRTSPSSRCYGGCVTSPRNLPWWPSIRAKATPEDSLITVWYYLPVVTSEMSARRKSDTFPASLRLSTVNGRPPTSLPSLCFQQLPTIEFSNPFILITMRIARVGGSPLPLRHLKSYFKSLPWYPASGKAACGDSSRFTGLWPPTSDLQLLSTNCELSTVNCYLPSGQRPVRQNLTARPT